MFLSVIAVCVVIAAAGCLAPALRALRLDPVAAIRLTYRRPSVRRAGRTTIP